MATGYFTTATTDGSDSLWGGPGNDTIDGLAGNDTIVGQRGDDLIHGGAGNDQLGVFDFTIGPDGHSYHWSGLDEGSDLLDGGDGDDLLIHDVQGADTVMGGSGNDTIALTFGAAPLVAAGVLDGGDGTDALWLETFIDFGSIVFRSIETMRWVFDLAGGEVTASVAQLSSFTHIDGIEVIRLSGAGGSLDLSHLITATTMFRGLDTNAATSGINLHMPDNTWGIVDAELDLGGQGAWGSAFNDTMTGGTNGDLLSGNAGDDRLFGARGNDSLSGGAGNDVLNGGVGADTLAGGAGNDVYVVDSAGDAVTEAAGEGNDAVRTTMTAYTLGDNLERLVYVGKADFTGFGNGLANSLTGAAGDDTLTGGIGCDRLTGGGGADVFRYTATGESVYGSADRIVDFTSGDRIDVSAVDADVAGPGDQAFVLDAFGDTSFATCHIRQIQLGANLILDFNTDADPQLEMRVVLLNHGPITTADISL